MGTELKGTDVSLLILVLGSEQPSQHRLPQPSFLVSFYHQSHEIRELWTEASEIRSKTKPLPPLWIEAGKGINRIGLNFFLFVMLSIYQHTLY